MIDKNLLKRAVEALEKLADAQADQVYHMEQERGYDSERPPRLWRRCEVGKEVG